MARPTKTSIAQPLSLATPPDAFSPAQWAELAAHLVDQDAVLLPGNGALSLALGDSDAIGEREHRKASGLALASHWASLGFALSKADALRLCTQDLTVHAWMHKHITPSLKKRLGGHVRLDPMYPNFPKQVMEAGEAELAFNALAHYSGDLFDVRIVPDYQAKTRKPLGKREGQVRALALVDAAALKSLLGNLVAMNTVWTPAQSDLAKQALPLMLAWDVVGAGNQSPQRENQAHLMGAWLAQVAAGRTPADIWPSPRVATTDLLRAAVAYSGGDPSLASRSPPVRFARFSRAMRRVIMAALERAAIETADPLSDMHTHRQTWLRLAEQLHVGEWKAMPKARALVDALRNAPAPVSWRGELDALLARPANTPAQVSKVADLMATNPGFAARALRRILAWADTDRQDIIQAFEAIAPQVDTPVLLALDASMQADANGARARVMLPKGLAAWRYRVDAQADRVLDAKTCQQVGDLCQDALRARFALLAPMGKVFIEDGLDDVITPKGLRSASSSVGVVARGSQLPVDAQASILRLFLWWTDSPEGRVDVDLSAMGVDQDFEPTQTCNYHSMREAGMVHSGDFTSAPNGAAEFVDVNIAKLDKRTRYIVLTANVFSGPNFSKLPECFVGWQSRNSAKAQRGKIMEIKTVVNKLQVTAPAKGFAAAAFDVKLRKLIWLDLPVRSGSGYSIHGSGKDIRDAIQDFQLYAASQPKIASLIHLHIQARGGKLVKQTADADVIFSLTTRVAGPGQTVIAATQPQAVAGELLAGPSRTPSVDPASITPGAITKESNQLDGLLDLAKKVPMKARKCR